MDLLNEDFPLKKETYNIIGAAMEVHKYLGCGFLEAVYHEAFEIELKEQSIPYFREQPINITYKGHKLSKQSFNLRTTNPIHFSDFLRIFVKNINYALP